MRPEPEGGHARPRRKRSATAQASQITVRATSAPPVLRIEIIDDGIGGALQTVGCGLRNRVESLGGSFEVDSPAGQGTRVAAVIPAASHDHV